MNLKLWKYLKVSSMNYNPVKAEALALSIKTVFLKLATERGQAKPCARTEPAAQDFSLPLTDSRVKKQEETKKNG